MNQVDSKARGLGLWLCEGGCGKVIASGNLCRSCAAFTAEMAIRQRQTDHLRRSADRRNALMRQPRVLMGMREWTWMDRMLPALMVVVSVMLLGVSVWLLWSLL